MQYKVGMKNVEEIILASYDKIQYYGNKKNPTMLKDLFLDPTRDCFSNPMKLN